MGPPRALRGGIKNGKKQHRYHNHVGLCDCPQTDHSYSGGVCFVPAIEFPEAMTSLSLFRHSGNHTLLRLLPKASILCLRAGLAPQLCQSCGCKIRGELHRFGFAAVCATIGSVWQLMFLVQVCLKVGICFVPSCLRQASGLLARCV